MPGFPAAADQGVRHRQADQIRTAHEQVAQLRRQLQRGDVVRVDQAREKAHAEHRPEPPQAGSSRVRASFRPYRTPIPVGPSILWAENT